MPRSLSPIPRSRRTTPPVAPRVTFDPAVVDPGSFAEAASPRLPPVLDAQEPESGVMEARVRGVLVVDDDELVRARAAACLESQGYRVTQAGNGKSALLVLRAARELPLVLLDWWMPVMNGERFLNAVAREPRFAQLSVAIMSTDSNAALRYSRAYIPKPFTTRLFLHVVERLAARTWPQPCRGPGGCW
jgi:CheY-like chemotaxis protein